MSNIIEFPERDTHWVCPKCGEEWLVLEPSSTKDEHPRVLLGTEGNITEFIGIVACPHCELEIVP